MKSNKLEKILDLLFKTDNTKICALKLLTTIKDRQRSGNPLSDSEWESWIKEHNVSKYTYDSVLGLLRRQGLIYKNDRCFWLNSRFISDMFAEWSSFLGVSQQGYKE